MKAIVTGALGASEAELRQLEALGLEMWLHSDERVAPDKPEQFDAAICNNLFLFDDISKYKNLKYIQLTSVGTDRVPLDRIRERGIVLRNAAGVYSVPMAEFAVCGILELYKQSAFFRENQSAGVWSKHRGLRELDGKTVCILGCGDVGRETAKRLRAFGCKILGINRTVRVAEHFDTVLGLEMLRDTLPQADIFICSVALTDETRGIVDPDVFAAMKDGAVFVNVARGALCDEIALIDWLGSGRSGGAVLDVFESEPLDGASPLWRMDNVILTPHNSFVGENNHRRLMDTVIKNLDHFLRSDGI